ncbi:sodium/hydrogen exchanger family protein [Colletotrichum fioriniae PJ7]|uniref:Sodium/hydrogen exchanger family protein n=1 Tax=Colletotrichum fioriniae PJ7 TaxID=1445577 RepID=A0A010R6Q3_9PEZI|nr:sodium/hydrogen exchanger family protein [Colletotrichum fioriniae PJ7]
MPTFDPSELNVVLAVFGAFIILFGIISVKIKNVWYLGEACKINVESSIPILNIIYGFMGVQPVQEDAVAIRRRSVRVPPPSNAVEGDKETFIAFNRFSRPNLSQETLSHMGDDVSSVGDEKVLHSDLESGIQEARQNAELSTRKSFNLPRLDAPRSFSLPRTSMNQLKWDQAHVTHG